jgi:hypothetical protein
LLNLRKHSNQTELDQFFKTITHQKSDSQCITKSAFFQARKQLSHTAFIDLNHQLNNDIYKKNKLLKTWQGFRLCAVDGTSIRLPNESGITEHFGVHKGRDSQAHCAMGMASVFFDLLNHVVIDACVKPVNTSERNCAAEHLAYAGSNDLIIYDRGYCAYWLYNLHIKNNHMFCVRAKTNQELAIKSFIASGEKEAVVTFAPSKTSLKTCREKGLSASPIKLRLVRVELPTEVEVIITNLMDTERYPSHIFKSLYHARWGIEENYIRLKQWVEIENFSGKSALSVKQDFHAKILAMNLTAIIAIHTNENIQKTTKRRKLKYQINFAQALSKMKHKIILIILSSREDITIMLKQISDYLSQTIEAVRPGRTAPRRLKNIKNDIHYPAYKSSL